MTTHTQRRRVYVSSVDVVEVTTEDLARRDGGQVPRRRRLDAPSVARHQGVPVDDDLDWLAVEENPAILHSPPKSFVVK